MVFYAWLDTKSYKTRIEVSIHMLHVFSANECSYVWSKASLETGIGSNLKLGLEGSWESGHESNLKLYKIQQCQYLSKEPPTSRTLTARAIFSFVHYVLVLLSHVIFACHAMHVSCFLQTSLKILFLWTEKMLTTYFLFLLGENPYVAWVEILWHIDKIF
jgi:hypothetical protein